MANYAHNYFRLEIDTDIDEYQEERLIKFIERRDLNRIYEISIDSWNKECGIIRGEIISSWCEPIESLIKMVTELEFISSIRLQCVEEGCDYYSILKFDRKENQEPESSFEIVSL